MEAVIRKERELMADDAESSEMAFLGRGHALKFREDRSAFAERLTETLVLSLLVQHGLQLLQQWHLSSRPRRVIHTRVVLDSKMAELRPVRTGLENIVRQRRE